MTKPPRMCLDLLCSPKVALRRVLTRLNLTNCLIHLQPLVVAFFRSWEQSPASPAKTVNACKKRSSASPRGASRSPFLSLMYATDNTIHKEPFLSYLSSCFRYFCKLRGGRIINHRETRWQSASIVAKTTNETAHPGKRPGDPAAIATPRAR